MATMQYLIKIGPHIYQITRPAHKGYIIRDGYRLIIDGPHEGRLVYRARTGRMQSHVVKL